MTQRDDAVQIADSLRAKTVDGGLKWTDSIENDEFGSASGRFSYYIKSRDEDGLPPYRLQVFLKGESENRIVLELTSNVDDVELGTAFRSLYEAAKYSFLGIGGSIATEIMKDLGSL